MSTQLFENITTQLKQLNIEFDIFNHEPVFTSEAAREILGHLPAEGTKFLAIDTEPELAVLTPSERANFKLIKRLLSVKRAQLCNDP